MVCGYILLAVIGLVLAKRFAPKSKHHKALCYSMAGLWPAYVVAFAIVLLWYVLDSGTDWLAAWRKKRQ